ncbi:MAG: HAD-superfamily hydrolase subfamily [Acidimicrobiales bacterium]|nr:HAD-superfamily hydrolase subfamily [Acidimicrobiales bacterium]
MTPSCGFDLDVDVVVPTIGRPSLPRLLASLAASSGPRPHRILLVDDRHGPDRRSRTDSGLPAASGIDRWVLDRLEVLQGGGAGPASARNVGWRAASAAWVAFLDDDVVVTSTWLQDLAADLQGLPALTGATQGRIRVPMPTHRRPTDWERNVAGLERARWATADLACRRRVLAAVGGFDERFPRAYREDADLGLRVTNSGWTIASGARQIVHPVPAAPWSVSITKQAGNADDALMDHLHGPGWRRRAGAPRGRRPLHLATTALAAASLAAAVAGRRRTATIAGTAALAATVEFAARRLAPGPMTVTEVARIGVTSAVIPPVATFHWLAGRRRVRRLDPERLAGERPGAVLFDRDGTLVVDVPFNGDPAAVTAMPGAKAALDRLRAAGIPIGIVSNQSGVARGLIEPREVDAVHARVEELVGPFDVVRWCPHGPADACRCRKPAAGLVLDASDALGIDPRRLVVVGDIGSDIEAATMAGGLGLLVPTEDTRIEELDASPHVFAHLWAAVDHLLDARLARA